jgi:hypothetical protein
LACRPTVVVNAAKWKMNADCCRLVFQTLPDGRDQAREQSVVSVQEDDDVAPRHAEAGIPGSRLTPMRLIHDDDPVPVTAQDYCRIVC